MRGAVCRSYSSYARSLFCTNKKREAMAYQELALALQAQFYSERKNENVEEEALFLQALLPGHSRKMWLTVLSFFDTQ
jgi:hypothetical protein